MKLAQLKAVADQLGVDYGDTFEPKALDEFIEERKEHTRKQAFEVSGELVVGCWLKQKGHRIGVCCIMPVDAVQDLIGMYIDPVFAMVDDTYNRMKVPGKTVRIDRKPYPINMLRWIMNPTVRQSVLIKNKNPLDLRRGNLELHDNDRFDPPVKYRTKFEGKRQPSGLFKVTGVVDLDHINPDQIFFPKGRSSYHR